MGNSQYKLLNDKDWLYQKYIIEKKGTPKIAELAGAKTSNSVRQALIKFNIPIRTIRDGLLCDRASDGLILNIENKQIIEGSLLGDASLRVWDKLSVNAQAYFVKKQKFYEHISYVGEKLFGNNYEERISIESVGDRNYYLLRSLSNGDLTKLYRKWYPKSNNYIKLVPRDLKLTEISLLHWFLDDGFSFERKRKYKEGGKYLQLSRRKQKQIIIEFCSESFSKEDNEFLIEQINNNWALKASLRKTKKGTGYRVKISQTKTNDFFEVIGVCPVSKLKYKWKIS